MLISDEKTVCKKIVEIVETWAEENDIRTTAEDINHAGKLRGLAVCAEKIVNDGLAQRNAQGLIRSVLATLNSETKRLSDIKHFRFEFASDTTVPPGQEVVCLYFSF